MTSIVATEGPWAEILELANREAGGRLLVERLIERLREVLRSPGAALYLGGDRGLERHLVSGSVSFPAGLMAGEEHGFAGIRLPGGELIYETGDEDAEIEDDGLVVALAAAVRVYLLEQRLKRQRFEVNYRGVELEALYDVGLAIASTLNLEELAEEVLLRAVSLLDARRGGLYFASGGEYRLSRTFGGEARERAAFDDPGVARLFAAEESADQDLLPGAEHLLAVPVEADGEPRGLLVMGDKESRQGIGPFGPADRRTLSLLANQAAIALENAYLHRQALEKERMEREAELAADIQRRLLPNRLPEVDGLELGGWNRSALQVGGDYYDLLPLAGGRLAALVADVSGKGMPAALTVSTLYSALHLLVSRAAVGADLVSRLNEHIFESTAPNKFITLLVADIDPASGAVKYYNAGHNPGLLVHAAGGVEELEPGGFPLGLFEKGRFKSGTLEMASGDLLCFFSDGITECSAPDDEEYGTDRLVRLLESSVGKPLPEIIASVDADTTRFARGAPQADDQTLVLVRKT